MLEMKERLEELKELCRKYPIDIPVKDAAEFLHMHPESLRYSIVQGTCGFNALSWLKPGAKNRGFLIPTLPFYQALTGGALYHEN